MPVEEEEVGGGSTARSRSEIPGCATRWTRSGTASAEGSEDAASGSGSSYHFQPFPRSIFGDKRAWRNEWRAENAKTCRPYDQECVIGRKDAVGVGV
jgi:hypothetical protein